ncbi:hypothetical protein ACET3Z_025653 [Daucus carota]
MSDSPTSRTRSVFSVARSNNTNYLSNIFSTRRSTTFACTLTIFFILSTIFFVFSHLSYSSKSPAFVRYIVQNRSHFSAFFSHIFPPDSSSYANFYPDTKAISTDPVVSDPPLSNATSPQSSPATDGLSVSDSGDMDLDSMTNVFEASGKVEFKTKGSYSFLFTNYNFSVEFFRSNFLVQEWWMPDGNGSNKETLRIDLMEKESERYEKADVLIFNTGHWWTHSKTSSGKGYYQEGNHVYDEMDGIEAYQRALTTWAKWIDSTVNFTSSLVFFRSYSPSHFRGGQWNSGGQCDNETEPIINEKYININDFFPYLDVLEKVLKGMKAPVFYLNITRMSDFRKDAHPSIFTKPYLTEEERRAPERFQDCTHWCLPGVPDTWNEIVYAQLLRKYYLEQKQKQREKPKQ